MRRLGYTPRACRCVEPTLRVPPPPPPPPASPAPPAVEVASKYSTVDTLRQQYMFVPAKHKDCYLTFLLTGGWGRRGWVAAAGPGCLWRR